MKKYIVTLAAGLTAFAVNADVIINPGSAGASAGRILTVTEDTLDTIVSSATTGTFTNTGQQASGTFSSATAVGAFSYTFRGYNAWDIAAASNAMVNGTAETFIAAQTEANVTFNNSSGVFGGSSNFRMDIDQAMVLTFDTSALNAGMQLSIKEIDFVANFNDRTTMAIYDTLNDTIREVEWAGLANWTGDILINNGDIMIVSNGTGGTSTDSFGMGAITYDVIPEPATMGLVAGLGGALLFIRRRLII